MVNFTSLCVLSYNRPEMTKQSLDSLIANTTSPYELIVNDDGSEVTDYLIQLYREKKISKLVLQNGGNRGIKHANIQAFEMAEGKYIYKLDTDVIYTPKWLEKLNGILDADKGIGAVGAFDYTHYDPSDKRFVTLSETPTCKIVSDFVPSVMGMPKWQYENNKKDFDADGWQLALAHWGFRLAIPHIDVVKNIGFGVGPSTFVIEKDGKIQTTPYHDNPYLMGIDSNITNI